MRIKLRQVEGFLAAADSLSFSRAAEKIGMTQPAFSQLIRDLESALDVKLFDRSTRKVSITDTGLQLRDQMRRGLMEIDDACNNARAITRLERGQLSLAVLPSLALGLVSDALASFHRTYPGVKIRLQEARSPYIADLVMKYEVDFAVCTRFAAVSALRFEHLFDDELVAVLPKGHALARQRILDWQMLTEEALIWLAAQSTLIRRAFEQNDIDKSADHEVLNTVTALSMVRAGFGITIVPLIALPELNMRGLIHRRLRAPQPVRDICLCSRNDHALSPAAERFRQNVLAAPSAMAAVRTA
jgi:LysR family carnitine catabolism transcriptional activator